jgi:plastocyanin
MITFASSFRTGIVVVFTAAGLAVSCSKPEQQPQKRVEAAQHPAYYTVDPKTAGVLAGKISFTGKRPVRKKIDMTEDTQCSQQHATPMYDEALVANRNGTLSNVFVYIKDGLNGKVFAPPAEPVTIDQHGCWFEPRVLGIQVGQTLRVTNSDPVTHNIHPLAEVNRAWNQSQSEGSPALQRRFTKPEVMIKVKCNIHQWMRAWIGVVEHPYFAVTRADGSFEIGNVPPGQYTIEAWQEELGTKTQQVTVEPSGKTTVNLAFKN